MQRDKILAVIGARGGSKGVKHKNIRLLLGKPLIVWTIEQALESGMFDRVVLTSDSDAIMSIASQHGADVFFKRPAEFSSDTAPKIPAIRHALIETEKRYQKRYEMVVDLDATSPLRSTDDIRLAIERFIANDYDVLITAMPSRRSPYFNLVEMRADDKVELSKQLEKPIARRQDSPQCFDMNASFDVWKRDVLMRSDTLFTGNTGIYVMPEERSIDIDSALDWRIVEMLMADRDSQC